jgi:hypothetical protein
VKLFEKQFVVFDCAGSRFFIFRGDVDLALKHHMQNFAWLRRLSDY